MPFATRFVSPFEAQGKRGKQGEGLRLRETKTHPQKTSAGHTGL
jgi:hypothetical protein